MLPAEVAISENRIPLSLDSPLLIEVEECCREWKTLAMRGDVLASRVGNLMIQMEETGELHNLGYSSIHKFIHGYLEPLIGRGVGTLYNWRRMAKAKIPERLVLERGSSVALEIAKEVPQPGAERERFVESIPEGAGLREVQELRAIRRHQPLAAIRQGAMTILGTEEEVEQAKQDLATWRARHQEHGGASDALLISEAVGVASMDSLLPGYRAMRGELASLVEVLSENHARRVAELLAEAEEV